MEIKRLTTEYGQQVYKVLCDAFENPWSVDTVNFLLESDCAICFGAFEGGALVGYAALEWVFDEGSLTDIAVLMDFRGKGIAKLLMNELIKAAKEQSLSFVTLEVRESNVPAVSLYRRFGFEDVGKRPRYYKNPTEDALLMTKYLYE